MQDDDRRAILKYQRADSAKIAQLTLQAEKMARLTQEAQAALNKEVTETRAVQVSMVFSCWVPSQCWGGRVRFGECGAEPS